MQHRSHAGGLFTALFVSQAAVVHAVDTLPLRRLELTGTQGVCNGGLASGQVTSTCNLVGEGYFSLSPSAVDLVMAARFGDFDVNAGTTWSTEPNTAMVADVTLTTSQSSQRLDVYKQLEAKTQVKVFSSIANP